MTGRSHIKRSVRQAAGDVRQISRLVDEAEKLPWPDKKELGDVYAVAMNAIGPLPLQTAPEEYGELCVKRLMVLCHVDPEEAKTFNSFLTFYGIRQEDPRLQHAVTTLGRDSLVLGSPPRVPEKEQRAAPAGENSLFSFTPLRPRNLSYSSCDTTRLEEAIAQVAAQAFAEKDSSEGPQRPAQPVTVPSVPSVPSVPRKEPTPLLTEPTTRSFPRVSAVDLSPIPEDRERLGPRGAKSDGADEARQEAQAPEAAQGLPKLVVVNGVSYTRLQTIGRGGTSKVYQVRSPCGKLLALKRVTASCPKHFEALANEVTLLLQLKECPNIIQVLDAEVLPDRLLIHIVMEEGQMDLGRLLQSHADMSIGDVQALWRQMLEAVQVVHQERVVHSDLKPGNFMLVKQRLKLIDFGIAKRIASNTTNISRESSVGTISYMAPEAVKQGAVKIGRPSDVWSLGIILYQMIYMRAPFAHLDPMQRLFALTDPNVSVEFPASHRFEQHSKAMKDTLLDVLQRCLQRDPARRPTIPELLQHPFVLREDVRLSRASFDRTFEALLQQVVAAAEEGLGSEPGGDADEGGKPRWQSLADEVWQQLVDGEADEVTRGRSIAAALQPFKEWLARGAKRQRVTPRAARDAAPAAAPASGQCSVPSSKSGHPPVPSAAPRSQSKGAVHAANARVPLHQLSQNAVNARDAGVRKEGGASCGPGGRVAIHAEALQKQRTNLRKASRPPGKHVGKENMGPKNTATAGFAADNLVLKRLKDRRAMLDDKADDETDTAWGR